MSESYLISFNQNLVIILFHESLILLKLLIENSILETVFTRDQHLHVLQDINIIGHMYFHDDDHVNNKKYGKMIIFWFIVW